MSSQSQGRGTQGRPPLSPQHRASRPYANGPQARTGEQAQLAEPRPKPLGDKCNPLCPFFRCAQNALRITTAHYRGRPVKVAICSLVGDRCVGPQCRFAYCEKRAMLPDGRCAFAVEGRSKPMKSFEEELQEEMQGFKVRGVKNLDEL